jgi:chromosome segregation ATPase
MEHSLKAQESAVSQLSKELVKLISEHKHTEDTLRAEEQKVTQLNKSIKEVTESISEKKKDLEVLKADSSKVEEKNKKLADDTAELQRKYEAMAVGMSVDSTSGGNKTLADRLMGVYLLHCVVCNC